MVFALLFVLGLEDLLFLVPEDLIWGLLEEDLDFNILTSLEKRETHLRNLISKRLKRFLIRLIIAFGRRPVLRESSSRIELDLG